MNNNFTLLNILEDLEEIFKPDIPKITEESSPEYVFYKLGIQKGREEVIQYLRNKADVSDEYDNNEAVPQKVFNDTSISQLTLF